MKSINPRTAKIATAAATPLAILVAAGMVWQSSNAAFSGQTRSSGNSWSAGEVALTDDDAGAARFHAENLVPGQTDTKCLTVTASTTVPGVVKGYTLNPLRSVHGLEDHITVTMEAGSGGGFGSCDGFQVEETVVPSTTLRQLMAFDSFDQGVGGWHVPAGRTTRTYRVTWTFATTGMTQNEVDQLQGDKTGVDLQWELQSS